MSIAISVRTFPFKPALTLCLLLSAACSKKEAQHVTVSLKSGESYAGTLETRDDKTVTVITTRGEAKTFLMRQVASIAEDKSAAGDKTAASPAPVTASPSSATAVPAAASGSANFVPPVSGVLTLRAGTPLVLRMREGVDGGAPNSEYGVFLSAATIDEINAEGAAVPANAAVNLYARNQPGTGGKQMVFQLSGMVIGGRTYRPGGAKSSGPNDPLLGKLSAPPAETLPSNLRDTPLHIEMFSAVEFKLPTTIALREVK
jgi:small nuclear ribonucleoprotein (snRNP)-like protein